MMNITLKGCSPRGLPAVFAASLALSVGSAARAQCEVQSLTEPNGWSVHLDGNVVALGRWNGSEGDAHQVFVYRRAGLGLVQEAVLTAPSGSSHLYGIHVHAAGEWVAVGDPFALFGGGSGKVYMYRDSDGDWPLVQEVVPPADTGAFGHSVSMDGDQMLIGAFAWTDDFSMMNIGKAYAYRLRNGQWVFEAELPNPDPHPEHFFGWSVAISGDRAVIGAPGAHSNGRAYVYERIGGEWTFTQELIPDQPKDFGRSVAIAGDVIAVGAYLTLPLGRVYLYGPGDTTAIIDGQDLPVVPFQSNSNVGFGREVALTEGASHLLAGAYRDAELGFDAGAAFLLRRDENDDWVFQKKLIGSNVGGGNNYGGALALAGDFAIIGATNSSNVGKVHLYAGILGEDCNGSGQPDACDIFYGDSQDSNNNLVPDECEVPPKPGDLNGDGVVDTLDLLILLGAWGECEPPAEPPAEPGADGCAAD